MTSPKHWLPSLVHDDWTPSVDSLLAEGTDVEYTTVPSVHGADQTEATGSIQDQVKVKVYEGADEEHAPNSWGDKDKDRTATWVLDAQASGSNAPGLMNSTRKVLVRILERHRVNPHPSWQRIDAWRVRQAEDYNDYQHATITLTLTKLGVVMPSPVNMQEVSS